MKKIDPKALQDLELRQKHASQAEQTGPLLGIDVGAKHCGLAWSPDGAVVLSLGVVDRGDLIKKMDVVVKEKSIEQLIFGLPIDGKGEENQLCLEIRKLGRRWESHLDVHYVNERYSSKTVLGVTGKERRDDLSAMQIVEYFMQRTSSK